MNHANQIDHPVGKPETVLEGASSDLNLALNSLGVTAETLVQRLSNSVLRPEVVVQMVGTAKMPEAPPRAAVSNAVERLMDQRLRVDRITAQLQQALDRLEA